MIGARKLYFVEKTTIDYGGFSSSGSGTIECEILAIFDTYEKAEKYLEHHEHKDGSAEINYDITEVYNIKSQYVEIDI